MGHWSGDTLTVETMRTYLEGLGNQEILVQTPDGREWRIRSVSGIARTMMKPDGWPQVWVRLYAGEEWPNKNRE